MTPKKATKLYKQVAEDLHIDEALVEDFVEYLYKNVRSCLSNLSYPRINVEGLGHFNVKPTWVRRSIKKSTELLENHDTSTFGAYSKKIKVEEKLNLLIELEHKISLEEIRKTEFKKLKDESSTKDNLGE